MKLLVRTSAALLVAGIALLSSMSAHAECSAIKLRLGLINTEDCTITVEDLYRAIKAYELRKGGLRLVEYTPPKPKPLPDLIVELDDASYVNGIFHLSALVTNQGNGDAGASKVSALVEFNRVSIVDMISVGPEVRPVQSLRPGAHKSVNIGPIANPDPYYTYDVVLTLTADSAGEVQERNETNNPMQIHCRLMGDVEQIHPTSAEWQAGMRYCSGVL